MAKPVYNQAGTFSYTVTVGPNAEPIVPYALVSARLYLDSPTQAQIDDTSNALTEAEQYITTWVEGFSTGEKLISYEAISDPEPTGSSEYEIFYWVISYRLESGGTIFSDVEPWVVYRAEGIQARFDVTQADLITAESRLRSHFTEQEATDKISLAERLVTSELRGKGLDIKRLDQSDAKDLVRFKALVISCFDLMSSQGDDWQIKAEVYAGHYKMILDSIVLGYDTNDDGLIEPEVEEAGPVFARGFFIR